MISFDLRGRVTDLETFKDATWGFDIDGTGAFWILSGRIYEQSYDDYEAVMYLWKGSGPRRRIANVSGDVAWVE